MQSMQGRCKLTLHTTMTGQPTGHDGSQQATIDHYWERGSGRRAASGNSSFSTSSCSMWALAECTGWGVRVYPMFGLDEVQMHGMSGRVWAVIAVGTMVCSDQTSW